MATKKTTTKKTTKVNADEKLPNQDVNLFEILEALDKKDYDYYSRLTPEQQKKVAMFILPHWMSGVKANAAVQAYYLQSIEYHANKYFLNEQVSKHPTLQWQMLCASSPGLGKQFHQWIPNISPKVANLKEVPKPKDIKDYYAKVYPSASADDLDAIGEAFVEEQKKKVYLANKYPEFKVTDIEALSKFVTQDQIDQYEKDLGNK
jgi:anion-transporting  ArsA/GET3 family ATPase